MIKRLALIREVGGNAVFLGTVVLLIGCIAFPVAEFFFFQGFIGLCFVIGLTTLGWFFRGTVMEFGVEYGKQSTLILFLYGVILFLVKRLGFGHHAQLVTITIATAVMYNLNLWSISEAALLMSDEPTANIELTPLAAREILAYTASPEAVIRIDITGNPMGGYTYGMSFDTPGQPDDIHMVQHNVNMVISGSVLPLCEGTTIDWESTSSGGGFRFHNPNDPN